MEKRGIVTDYLMWLLIGIAVLVVLIIFISILKNQGGSLIDSLKSLLRGI